MNFRDIKTSRLLCGTLRSAFCLVCACLVLFGCGGGGGSSTPEPVATPEEPPPPVPACSVTVSSGPFESTVPGTTWERRSPASQGLCPDDLEDARDYAFASLNTTGAMLVIKNGYVVFEEYASDRNRESLVTSWSVGKSFSNMLMGAAITDGYIASLEENFVADYVDAWVDTPKDEIRLYDMMTVRTALNPARDNDFYRSEPDQLAFALGRSLIGEPGNRLYNYSNADVMIVDGVIRGATGMDSNEFLDVRIGETIGMHTTEWWTDNVGNVLTYCCVDAIPEDFARFGLLHARWGDWNGQQVISEEWITTTTRFARAGAGNGSGDGIDGGYGFYWWPIGFGGFGAFGLHSQIVAIYPSIDMVVLRFSRYTRLGDGTTRRWGDNWHGTQAPLIFSNAEFLRRVREALAD